MNNHQLPTGPALLVALDDAPLKPIDILGRQKCLACGLNKESSEAEIKKTARSSFATIERNAFKFKSLSCWSYNIALGCMHGCRFCYVPDAQQTGPGKEKQNNGPLAKILREFGVVDPDADWGKYLLLRPFDEEIFLASLKAAENTPLDELNPDGNRAIILCSTTDPYQTIVIPGDPGKQNLLNQLRRHLVRRALELILEHSTLKVRILTRSPLAKEDFDLYKSFGKRLLFGMSLATLDNKLAKIYEPHAPAPSQRLATLRAAKEAGIPIFVAMAPTYPECNEADLRATLEAIRALDPVTVFHEPINIRADNVERIAAHARELGVELKSEVFQDTASWRLYAYKQLLAVERITTELGLLDRLHLWPDASFKSKAAYRHLWPADEGQQWEEKDDTMLARYYDWITRYHNRISEWPVSNIGALSAPSSTPVATSAGAAAQSAPVEFVGDDNLSDEDREVLGEQEGIIASGQETFVQVGRALIKIRDYKNGILYQSYGTFENYCRQRWEFGRSYAHRVIEAATIYQKMLPRGNITEEIVMPTTERQLRELGRLSKLKFQKQAWKAAVAKAGEIPIRTRLVALAVRSVMEREGLPLPSSKGNSAKPQMFRIAAESVTKIRAALKSVRTAVAKFKGSAKVATMVDEIEALLPQARAAIATTQVK